MMRSRRTLATTEAAAIAALVPSPLTIARASQATPRDLQSVHEQQFGRGPQPADGAAHGLEGGARGC